MKILIACETSGIVREAFLASGHDAWSCDILKSDVATNRHIQDDVRNVLAMDDWDMLMVAHPPCTRLCLSGARWYKVPPPGKTLEQMEQELIDGCQLLSDLWNADVPKIAIENPVMLSKARKKIQEISDREFPWNPTQYVQPYEFAESIDAEDNITKKTSLWLKNLPPLIPTGTLTKETARDDIHKAPPGPDRWKIRSKFHHGMAKAMAEQWGGNLIKEAA
tara:strand:+ start:280 stop:942 length:663 start_codon:yes stop_codon:yes gene_type:complete